MLMSSESESVYDPSYRQQDVDQTLDEHDSRINRLEKVALAGIGYGLAEGSNIVTEFAGFI